MTPRGGLVDQRHPRLSRAIAIVEPAAAQQGDADGRRNSPADAADADFVAIAFGHFRPADDGVAAGESALQRMRHRQSGGAHAGHLTHALEQLLLKRGDLRASRETSETPADSATPEA